MTHTPDPSHTRQVQDIFERVSGAYDVMNDLMSLGIHRCWKDTFVSSLPLARLYAAQASDPLSPLPILDMASGTGDIARRLLHETARLQIPLELTRADLNHQMLREGQKKSAHTPTQGTYVCTDATQTPFQDHAFGLYTIAFGLRNVTDQSGALQEAWRVLRPGGFFYCLEFSHVNSPLMTGLYDLYAATWIPFLGKYIAKDPEAYDYLVQSIRSFPPASLLETMVCEAGFQQTGFRTLAGGIVAIHWGQKPF